MFLIAVTDVCTRMIDGDNDDVGAGDFDVNDEADDDDSSIDACDADCNDVDGIDVIACGEHCRPIVDVVGASIDDVVDSVAVDRSRSFLFKMTLIVRNISSG